MADSNRVKLRYSRETTWGETVSGPATTELRITSESLEHQKQTVTSDTIRSDGQRDAVLEVGQSAQGAINIELAYGDYEPFFETALRGAIASVTFAGTQVSTTASAIVGGAAADFATSGFEAGQWIRLNATGETDDNAVVQVASVTDRAGRSPSGPDLVCAARSVEPAKAHSRGLERL